MKYCKLAKFVTNQNVNVIFAVIGMMDKIRHWNRKNIKNYVEIYIKSDLKLVMSKKKKKYTRKKQKMLLDWILKQNIQTSYYFKK